MLAALTGLFGVGPAGCHGSSASESPGFSRARWSAYEVPRERLPPPLPPHTYVADTAACEDDYVRMPNEPRVDARTTRVEYLEIEARAAYARGDLECARLRYEQAWVFALPARHDLLYFIGALAYELGDCTTARRYLELFLDERDGTHRLEIREARRFLGEIERRNCAAPRPPVQLTAEPWCEG